LEDYFSLGVHKPTKSVALQRLGVDNLPSSPLIQPELENKDSQLKYPQSPNVDNHEELLVAELEVETAVKTETEVEIEKVEIVSNTDTE